VQLLEFGFFLVKEVYALEVVYCHALKKSRKDLVDGRRRIVFSRFSGTG